MSRRITIFDTTLRDGEQSPGIALKPDEKAEIAEQLERLGVDVIEAGFADRLARRLRGRPRRRRARSLGPTVASLARTRREDIDAAVEALADAPRSRLHIFLATSPIHMERKLGIEPDEVVEQARSPSPTPRARRRGRVLVRGRDPLRPGLRRAGLPDGDRGRRDDDQPPGHGRLRLPERVRATSCARCSGSARSSST